jgi:hypothetical protein
VGRGWGAKTADDTSKREIHQMNDQQETYTNRQTNLTALNFTNYGQYLKSRLWSLIRSLVLIDGVMCKCCGRNLATKVHHQSYSIEVLEGKDLGLLVPVCAGCHLKIEFTCGGGKRTIVNAICTCKNMMERLERKSKFVQQDKRRCHQCGYLLKCPKMFAGLCKWCHQGHRDPWTSSPPTKKKTAPSKKTRCHHCKFHLVKESIVSLSKGSGLKPLCKWCLKGTVPPIPQFKQNSKGRKEKMVWQKKFGPFPERSPEKMV